MRRPALSHRNRLTLPPSMRTLVTARLDPQAVRTRGVLTVTGRWHDATVMQGCHAHKDRLLIYSNNFGDGTVTKFRSGLAEVF